MKKIVFSLSLLLANLSIASSFELSSLKNETLINSAKVVDLYKLQTANTGSGPVQVNLLVVSKGGSTDVSPRLDLYMTFWVEGEIYNVYSNYFMPLSVLNLLNVTNDNKNKTVAIKVEVLADSGQRVKETLKISYGQTIKAIDKWRAPGRNNDGQTFNVPGTLSAEFQTN